MEKELSERDLAILLVETGRKLLAPPPGLDKLLSLLDNAEDIFSSIAQDPSRPLRDALVLSLKALISENLLRHPHMDVQVSVLSCIHELVRLSAPDALYDDDDVMMEIFQQTVIVFGLMPLYSGRFFNKAVHILDTVAKVRSSLVLLDLGCDRLIVQMFQLLLANIRPDHPDNVFASMEAIITRMILESDELSIKLIRPLLICAQKENQPSWRLAVKVLQNCSATIKPFLVKFVEQMREDIVAYTEILASVLPDTPAEENVRKEADADASDLVPMLGDGTAEQRDNPQSSLVIENSSKEIVVHEQIEQLQIVAKETVVPEALESGGGLQTNASMRVSKKRGRKPVCMRRPEEGYEHSEMSGAITSSEVSRKRKNHIEVGSKSEKFLPGNSPSQSAPAVLLDQTSLRYEPKKKETMKNVLVKTKEDSLITSALKGKATAKKRGAKESLPRSYKKRSNVKKYGKKLVGSRVKVWWPVDKEFYEGVVESYDSSERKHKVVYLDGDVEMLRLRKERWILLDGLSSRQQGQVANLTSSAAVHVRFEKEGGASIDEDMHKKTVQENIAAGSSSMKNDDADDSSKTRPMLTLMIQSQPADHHQPQEGGNTYTLGASSATQSIEPSHQN